MKKFILLTVFSIFFYSPKVNAEKIDLGTLSPDELEQMSGCLNNSNIKNFLSNMLLLNSPLVQPLVTRSMMGGRMTTICDLYVNGFINLRTAKLVSKNALEFYDKNPNLKRDLDTYSKQPGLQSCQKIWQK